MRVRVAAPDPRRRTVPLVPEILAEHPDGIVTVLTHPPSMASRDAPTRPDPAGRCRRARSRWSRSSVPRTKARARARRRRRARRARRTARRCRCHRAAAGSDDQVASGDPCLLVKPASARRRRARAGRRGRAGRRSGAGGERRAAGRSRRRACGGAALLAAGERVDPAGQRLVQRGLREDEPPPLARAALRPMTSPEGVTSPGRPTSRAAAARCARCCPRRAGRGARGSAARSRRRGRT